MLSLIHIFAYEEEQILKDYSISIPKGSRIGIHGKSGSGKSTLLKLLMRFYDVDSGVIRMGDRKLSGINTNELRDMESYVTQETCLFHDSIEFNGEIYKFDYDKSMRTDEKVQVAEVTLDENGNFSRCV